MIPRFKKYVKVDLSRSNKEEFLFEHNKLSPSNLQATLPLLARFRIEKASLFKDDNWPVDKLRRPFILWLMCLNETKKKI